MRKYHEVLVNAMWDRIEGNHAVKFLMSHGRSVVYGDDGNLSKRIKATRVFWYHESIICAVNDSTESFYCTHCGYQTQSTSCAINGYREYFSSIGYKEKTFDELEENNHEKE